MMIQCTRYLHLAMILSTKPICIRKKMKSFKCETYKQELNLTVYKFSCKAQKQYWLTIKEVHIKIHKEMLVHVLWQRFNHCVVQFHKFQQNSQVYRMLQVLWFVLVDFPGKTQFLHCTEIKKTDYRYDSMFLLSVV